MKEKLILINAFGLSPLVSAIKDVPGVLNAKANSLAPKSPNNYNISQKSTTPDPYLYIGSLGTPVWSNLEIESGSYIDNNGNTVSYPGVQIDTVLITVDQANIVVKDKVQGLDGSIKQTVSEDDWIINVKGVIIGGPDIYPRQVVSDLFRTLKSKLEIRINNWYLNQFGIYNIVIENRKFPMEAGLYSQQIFEFNAVSDTPVELQITN